MAVATRRRADRARAAPAAAFEGLSDEYLLRVAGPVVYRRGLAYWRQGRVEELANDGGVALFEVKGSEVYVVRLALQPQGLHTACDCAYAAGGEFCKHMVAAALHWRAQLGGEEPPAEPAAPEAPRATPERLAKAAQTRAANARALQDFLAQQPAAALAQRLWEHALAHRELMAEIKAWAAEQQAASDPKALRKAVEALLKAGGHPPLGRSAVRALAGRADKARALLQAALPQRAGDVRAVAEFAIRRIGALQQLAEEVSVELAEATDGFVGLLSAALEAAPPPASFGEHLLKLQLERQEEPWTDPRLAAALGAEAGRSYRRELERAWKAAPAPTRDGFRDSDLRRSRLRELMIAELDRQQDLPASFDFQRRTATHPFELASLVEWCEEHGRTREAIEIARDAAARFPADRRLEELLLRAYARDGWDEEVLAIRWRRFEQTPAPQLYGPLLEAGRAARADISALRRKAHAQAQAFEDQVLKRASATYGRYHPQREVPARDVTWRVGLHLIDGTLDEALALVQPPHRCERRVLGELATALGPDRAADAFALLRRCIDEEIQRDKSPYRTTLHWVARALALLKRKEQRDYLAVLAQLYKAKRVFVEGLSRLAAGPP